MFRSKIIKKRDFITVIYGQRRSKINNKRYNITRDKEEATQLVKKVVVER